MRYAAHTLAFVLAAMIAVLLLCDVAQAGDEIVGWGTQAVVVPDVIPHLTAVATGQNHNLGLKTDGSIVAWGWNNYGQCTMPTPNTGFIAVAAGGYHSLGLTTDGSVVAWGWNNYGQCTVPTPNTGFTEVAAGNDYSLGLKTDGSIVAWGNNGSGQCTVPTPNTGFIAVAAGYYHSLGLKTDGSIVAWGNNGSGQCTVPTPNTGFMAVAAGGFHSLGLKTDGSIVAWGWNDYGQSTVPPPNTGFIAVAAGGYHSLGLKTDGSIVAWGNNDYGSCTVPPPNTGFIAVAAGDAHSLGLKTDGSIAAWGFNYFGQCTAPTPNTGFMAVAAHYNHSLGLKTDGSIVAWGDNDYGQSTVPTPNTGFMAVAAGNQHSLGLKTDGSIVAWGKNSSGQCTVPTPNTGFIAMAAGYSHSLGLKTDGSIVAWGSDIIGQSSVPTPNTGFIAMAAGYSHSLGLKTDGSIVAWGNNVSGQSTVPTPNTGFIAVAAGDQHSLGLKTDGSIVAWGKNSSGQCTVPTPNTGFIAVAAGGSHSLGLKADGSIVAWGPNSNGQCTVPTPNTGFIAVAAGYIHSLGLKQMTAPPPPPTVVIVSPGETVGQFFEAPGSCAIRWQFSGAVAPDHYALEYRTSGDFPWRPINGDVSHGAQPQEFEWAMPPIGTESLCLRVTAIDASSDTLAIGLSQYPVTMANKYGVLIRHTHFDANRASRRSLSESGAVVYWPARSDAASYRVEFAGCASTFCGLDIPYPLGGRNVLPSPEGYCPHWLTITPEEFDAMPVGRYEIAVTGTSTGGEQFVADSPRDFIVCQLEDHDYREAAAPPDSRPPVLLVHGWTSDTEGTWYSGASSSFIDELRKQSSPRHAWSLEYPNIDAIRISACGLAEVVLYLRGLSGPSAPKVSLVAHSMGGLVCRAYLQDEVDPPKDPLTYPAFRNDVDRLVTLATPHLGGAWKGAAAWLQDNVIGCPGANHSGSYYDLDESSTLVTNMMSRQLPDSVEYLLTAGTDYVGQRGGGVGNAVLRWDCAYPNDGAVTVCSASGGHCQNDGEDRHLNVGSAVAMYRYYDRSHMQMANPGSSSPLVGDVVSFLRDGANGVTSEECPALPDEQEAEWKVNGVGSWALTQGSANSGWAGFGPATDKRSPGGGLAGALIRIRHTGDDNPSGGIVFVTNAEGRAAVGLPPGSYRADISAPGALARSEVFTFLPGGSGVSWPIELEAVSSYAGPLNPSIEINGGSVATDDSLVSVRLSCERATQYRLSEDLSFEQSEWQPLVSQTSYQMEGAPGQKFLFARFKGGDGSESNTVNASILLGTSNVCKLAVSTTGGSARVSLDSRDSGRHTPALFDSLAPGAHYVSVIEPGMVSDVATKVIVIAAGTTGAADFALTAVPPPPPVDPASLGSSNYWRGGQISWHRPTGAGPGLLLYDVSGALANSPSVPVWSLGATADTTFTLPAELPDSTEYVLRLMTRDGRGGVQADSATTRHFYLDRTSPDIVITAPSGDDSVQVGQNLTIAMHASDWGGMAHLSIFGSTNGGASYGDTLYSGAWADTVVWTVPLRRGRQQLVLRAEGLDRAGNAGVALGSGPITIGDPFTGVGDLKDTSFWFASPRVNPFSSSTGLEFSLPREVRVVVAVYDLTGRRVRTLAASRMQAGVHALRWDGRDDRGVPVGSGVYFCRMEAGSFRATRRMALVR